MAVHTLRVMGRDVEVEVEEPALSSPEENAWLTDIQQGISDRRDAELAAQAAAMDGVAYARFQRERKIGAPGLVEFLGGTDQ
jgi:hypothetical protein